MSTTLRFGQRLLAPLVQRSDVALGELDHEVARLVVRGVAALGDFILYEANLES